MAREIRFPKLTKVLQIFGETVEVLYREQLRENNHIATATLHDTLYTRVQHRGVALEVSIYLQDYWYWLENGRQAGARFPPIDKIREWIRIKPIIPQENDLGKTPTENQLVFLLSRSIAEKGIEGKPMLEDSVNEALQQLEQDIINALQEDVQDAINEQFIEAFAGNNKFKNITIRTTTR